jgi:solute carrier family 25 protein 39/40
MGNNNNIQPNSWLKELKDLIRTGGVKSLYRGVVPTLWRDVPFSAIYWLGVEQFRSRLQNSPLVGGQDYLDRGELIPPWLEASHAFMSGAAAGMIAAAVTTPFDVVKTRQQMVQTSTSSSQATATAPANMATTCVCHHNGAIAYNQHAEAVARRAGTLTHLKHIYNVEGVQGLWRGNQTRMIKVAPGCAIMISCYQFGKRILE